MAELKEVDDRLESIKRDKDNNRHTTRELEAEKRSQKMDSNRNNVTQEQSHEQRKKALENEDQMLKEADQANASRIEEEGTKLLQIFHNFSKSKNSYRK